MLRIKKKFILITEEKGQALFEFVIFLPLVLVLVSVLLITGNAINGSINQQKVTRGYFYFSIQHHSRLPLARDLQVWRDQGLNNIGHFAIGWAEKLQNERPYSTCYKYNTLFGQIKPDETCDDPDLEEAATQFVRPFTAYGVCSETYSSALDTDGKLRVVWLPFNNALSKLGNCQIEP